ISAPRMCGGLIATSTPQLSVNSHWFFGWFTRAITRATANSCFASSEITRLSSSSPVAETTTSARAASARSSTPGSHAPPWLTASAGALAAFPGLGKRGDQPTRHMRADLDAEQDDVARSDGKLGVLDAVEPDVVDLGRGPSHGRDRLDPQPLVDLGAAGVVDARDDALDVVVLLRNPRGHDVGVVSVGDRDVRPGVPDPGLLEGFPGEDHSHQRLTFEAGANLLERVRPLADARHREAATGQVDGQLAAAPAAATE